MLLHLKKGTRARRDKKIPGQSRQEILGSMVYSYLVLCLVEIDYGGVREEQVVSDNIRLGCRVSAPAQGPEEDRAVPRSLQPHVVALYGEGVGLVEGDPVLHPISKCLEACLSICSEVLSGFFIFCFKNSNSNLVRFFLVDFQELKGCWFWLLHAVVVEPPIVSLFKP